ncbi:hypothetical protein DOK67_0001660 [Enterococcus sp. DIV0212c]|uniref:hypothetical protein n=1 Tax=Enterococcus sp. DIV0212c TaxID=2230867 RepID=UPI001A9A7CBD|nr:hypothetical protein [Enterococcus sp. DIV0212c]MBO1354134.1 hypothetical protein [Enterococcus sp. DIV0212c]
MIKRTELGEKIFLLGYGIYIFWYILLETTTLSTRFQNNFYFNNLLNVEKIMILVVIISFFIIINKVYVKRSLFILILLLFVSLIAYVSAFPSLIMTVLIMYAASQVNFKKIIKVDIITKVTAVTITIMLYYSGIASQVTYVREDGLVRQSLGFSHPNIFAVFILGIALDYIYLRYNKFKIVDYFLVIGTTLIIGRLTDSRSAVLALFVSVILIFMFKSFPNVVNSKIISTILVYLVPIYMIVSYFLMTKYNPMNPILRSIDKLTSLRITYGNAFYKLFGVSALGNRIENLDLGGVNSITGYGSLILDNAYMSIILKFGIIFTIVICLFFIVISKKAMKLNPALMILIVVVATHGLMETSFYSFQLNIIYLATSFLIKNNTVNSEVSEVS